MGPEDARTAHIEGRELPSEDIVVAEVEPRPTPLPLRLVFLVVGLGLFVASLGLMRAGAEYLTPSLEGSIFTDNAWSTLGLGWLGACLVLSGSPVAASALTLLDGGAIDQTQAFTMLTGSRLGAAFVVLVVGVVYEIRNRKEASTRAPVSIGVLSLLMTAVVYVPGAVLGYALLERGAFDWIDIGTSPEIASVTDKAFGWIADAIVEVAPGWTLFPIGLAMLLVGFQCIDKVLPDVGAHRMAEDTDHWTNRKWPMFGVGCLVTTLTLSVSVSLTLLVPLVAKGHLRRANTLPYIAGANITTLVDTLVASILLGNQEGVQVVVAVTLVVSAWTVFLLATCYPLLRRLLLGVARRVLASNQRLAGFAAALFILPILLIAI
jgi:solute carrier family 34 (sodium-dependent phosphate cotransporter)